MSTDVLFLGASIILSFGTLQVYDVFLEFSLRRARKPAEAPVNKSPLFEDDHTKSRAA